jgi:hypothetical protein
MRTIAQGKHVAADAAIEARKTEMWRGARRPMRKAAVFALGLIAACYEGLSGGVDDQDVGEADDADADADAEDAEDDVPALVCEEIGAQPLRRISSTQYAQILRDLLPEALAEQALAVSSFPPTVIDGGFSTYASANRVSTNASMLIEDNAEAIAEMFFENARTLAPVLVPCLPPDYVPADVDACLDEFVEDFGRRAFRRPLTKGEREIIGGLYEQVASSDGANAGLTAVLQYFLQAPALLYVVERAGDAGELYAPLSPHELATRLALLFADSVPDEELLAAIEEGRLQSREDVEREARRLVARPEAVRAFARFHHEWMRGFVLETANRDHPTWNDETSRALREELGSFAAWFLAETDGTFRTLMTTQAFPVDPRLTPIYDFDADGTRAESPRHGLLTTAAAMSAQAHDRATSIVERGVFVLRHVMCMELPPFPGDIDIEAALEGYGDLPTGRERLEPLMLEPTCAGCHVVINPFGFPFEVYDWVGAYRTTENGATIDTSAEIVTGSLAGTFADARGLISAIAQSEEARDCYATHWFRYAAGRPEGPDDVCALDEITEAFAASGGDVRELLVAIAVSDAFRFRKIGGAE